MHETKLCVTTVRAKSHCQPFVFEKSTSVLFVLFEILLFWTPKFYEKADLHNEIKVGCIIKSGLRGKLFNRLWATATTLATDSEKALATNKATAKGFASTVTTPLASYTAIQQSSIYNKAIDSTTSNISIATEDNNLNKGIQLAVNNWTSSQPTNRLEPTEKSTQAEIDTFEDRKLLAISLIGRSIARHLKADIAKFEEPLDAWNHLKKIFESDSVIRIIHLLQQFLDATYEPQKETVNTFISRLRTIVDDMAELKFELPPILQAYNFLRGLPKTFDGMTQSLFRLKREEFTVKSVTDAIINEDSRIKHDKADPATALAVYKSRSRVQGQGPSTPFKSTFQRN
ncbi:hypothetical protein CHUAL_011491 [Chamberlinius hualienensis]